MSGLSAAERARGLWNLFLFSSLAYAGLQITDQRILFFMGVLQPFALLSYFCLRFGADPTYTMHDAARNYDALFSDSETLLLLGLSIGYSSALVTAGTTLGVTDGVRYIGIGLFLIQLGVTIAAWGAARDTTTYAGKR